MSRRRTRLRGHLAVNDEAPRGNGLLALGLVVVTLVALVAYLSTVAIDGGPLERAYEVQLRVDAATPGAPPLKDGDEVRIGGQRAGEVRRVEVDRADPTGARLTLALDGAVGRGVARDATVRVRIRGLAGATYLDLDPGTGPVLPSPARLPDTAASAAPDLADVVETFDAATRAASRSALTGFGGGLAGRGRELGETVATLGPAAARLTPLARATTPRPGELAALLGDLGTTVRAADADGALADAVPAARRTLDAVPSPAVDATLRTLPAAERTVATVLPQADQLLEDLRVAAVDLRPAAVSLRRAVPSLRAALRRDEALDDLARVGRAATPVLRAAAPLLRELRVPTALLRPLATPLGSLATHLVPYRREILLAPEGFTTWGGFRFAEGQASGARAVRFSMVLTCHRARDAYPAPGEALTQEAPCR
ncbi:MlaD family protein [Paraconexibacter algicola]|uniref:Mce/MlaD domain-containing protein n=1 Tax=Paraconexibacter algicola TaxID=2133960 RepID=A0A2T4UBK2_9ACTN|nr:MlaD family protein [Paraconexibacter algicola]PTL54270.1 hypothetical protein C7Y72_21210 [Paraconexibacter algicola]